VAIAHDHEGGGEEQDVFCNGELKLKATPGASIVCSAEPEPSETKSKASAFGVLDAEPPREIGWHTRHQLTCSFRRWLWHVSHKESAIDSVDISMEFFQNSKYVIFP
jgi:hypothetical protein